MKARYIKRTYRITPENDKSVKKESKKRKESESSLVRALIGGIKLSTVKLD